MTWTLSLSDHDPAVVGTVMNLSVHFSPKGPAAATQSLPGDCRSAGVWAQDCHIFWLSKEVGNQDDFDVKSPSS